MTLLHIVLVLTGLVIAADITYAWLSVGRQRRPPTWIDASIHTAFMVMVLILLVARVTNG